MFFAGLAAGPISVVAPLSALGAALIPVAAAIAGGERLSAAVLAGALLCLASVTLVSLESGPPLGVAARQLSAGSHAGWPQAWRSACTSCSSATRPRLADYGRWPSHGAPHPRSC